MKKIFLYGFLLAALTSAAQVVKIDHTYYTSWFSENKHIPVVVSYTLTQDMLQCGQKQKRKDKFKADPQHPKTTDLLLDYKNSGFDRGHNMPAADNECNSTGMGECFYFSNMTPQPHSFNAGLWEKLEDHERDEAAAHKKVIVVCGSLGERTTIGPHKVVVPEKMWKVIYNTATKEYKCYLFPNSDGLKGNFEDYGVPLNKIKEEAKVDFKDGAVKPEI